MDRVSIAAGALLCTVLARPVGASDLELTVSPEQARSLDVATARPTPDDRAPLQGLSARVVVPNTQLNVVSTPLPGLVETLTVSVTESARKGQVLARIQSPALAEAQRLFVQAANQWNIAEATLKRDESLWREGIIAESRYLAAQGNHAEAAAVLAERTQALRLAGMSESAIARLRSARAIASSLDIAAPADGVVLDQMATVGQRLDAYAPIYKIARVNPLWLEIQIPVTRAAGVRDGDPVTVPQFRAHGHVIAVGGSVDPDSQTVMVRALIDDNAQTLKPGQNVEATVVAAAPGTSGGWRVPNTALLRQDGKLLLFVRTPQGFRAQVATLVYEGAKESAIRAQLASGDEVVVRGIAGLKGMLMGLGGL
ncbi:MAG: efflux RND transporter periplasmic adaptor subunit [Burkholderiales bacterium]